MLPPPAPIETMSSVGCNTGRRFTVVSPFSSGRPSAISATSKVVPPTSAATRSGSPSLAPSAAVPITPPAGPDSSVRIGAACTATLDVIPPDDCMMLNVPA
jgi:hypothetical protein